MQENNTYIAGLYLRLSKDDEQLMNMPASRENKESGLPNSAKLRAEINAVETFEQLEVLLSSRF